MSALDSLVNKALWLHNIGGWWQRSIIDGEKIDEAAAELAALRARVEALEAGSIEKIALLLEGKESYGENGVIVITEDRYKQLEYIETVAEDVNEWLKRIDLKDTAHQRELEAALKS